MVATDLELDKEELVRLHTEEGLSATACAEELDVTPNTAIKYLRRAGVYQDGRSR